MESYYSELESHLNNRDFLDGQLKIKLVIRLHKNEKS